MPLLRNSLQAIFLTANLFSKWTLLWIVALAHLTFRICFKPWIFHNYLDFVIASCKCFASSAFKTNLWRLLPLWMLFLQLLINYRLFVLFMNHLVNLPFLFGGVKTERLYVHAGYNYVVDNWAMCWGILLLFYSLAWIIILLDGPRSLMGIYGGLADAVYSVAGREVIFFSCLIL